MCFKDVSYAISNFFNSSPVWISVLDILVTKNYSYPITISKITALSSDHDTVVIEVILFD